MSHSSSRYTFYKYGFWSLLVLIVVIVITEIKTSNPIERIESDPNRVPVSLMIQAKEGWIILSEAKDVNNTITIGKKVIYVTTRVDEHPSCLGCHSKLMEQRKIDKDIKCPIWANQGETQ